MMFVCVCHGITSKQIVDAVKNSGVGNVRHLKSELEIASQCGSCVQMTQKIIDNTIVNDNLFRNVG